VRIGILAPPWLPVPPRAYGGTEAVIDTLARGLARAGHQVTLWATGDSTCGVTRLGPDRPAVGFAHPDAAAFEAAWVRDGLEALTDCDVIHDHTTLAGALRTVTGAGRSGPPLVVTNHGVFHPHLQARFAAGGHDALVAISVAHARTAGVRVDAVIHHGLDLERYPVGAGRGGYLAFLGRMAPEKGAHRAIRVARAVGLPLRIAAKMVTPEEHRYFEVAVAPHLGDGVEFLGEIGFTAKVELLADALALVNPIRWAEPFGLVMAEALACGTPVLALGYGAAGEIVDHGRTGYLAATTGELTRYVARLDRLDRAACRASVEVRFSATRMVRDHLRLYRRLHRATGHRAVPTGPSRYPVPAPREAAVGARSPVG